MNKYNNFLIIQIYKCRLLKEISLVKLEFN